MNRHQPALFGILLLLGAFAHAEDPWADSVLDYSPVNPITGFTTASKALGAPAGLGPSMPNNGDVVCLGVPHASITLKFNTPVADNPANPLGLDCIVYSNSFWSGANPQIKFQEPAIIEISEDANGNGIADDPWYLIPGSNNYPYTGGILPTENEPAGADNESDGETELLAGNIRNPNTFDAEPDNNSVEFNWGYAEMSPTALPYLDNYLRPDDPQAVGITSRSGGGDAFDIAWAVAPSGAPAGITQFHFIRLTSFVNRNMGALGATSPEIAAVADVAPDIDTDGDGILDEYETRVAGTDPTRPESTILPLEIPALEGGSGPGTVLGTAEDHRGTKLRLFADQPRTELMRTFNCMVDILEPVEPGGGTLPGSGLFKSGVVRQITSSEQDFVAAGIQSAQITLFYQASQITGLDEAGLQPYRYNAGAYTQDGISSVEVNAAANLVTFRTQYAGLFILASGAGSGDEGADGPQGVIYLNANPADSTVVGDLIPVQITSGIIQDQLSQPVADGTLFTVTASLGTISSADADAGVPGVQASSIGGQISFTVAAPTISGDAVFTASAVQGTAYGELIYTFLPGPVSGSVNFTSVAREGEDPVSVTLRTTRVTDAFGNTVADGAYLTVTVDGADFSSSDADLTQSGHQIVIEGGYGTLILSVSPDAEQVSLSAYADEAGTVFLGEHELSDFDYRDLPAASIALMTLALGIAAVRTRRRGLPNG